ncbi:MAG: serine hydrolase domain-containing protein [Hyphomonas sp.]|uniref:serine hydrolase domain-containing protein n=1 Tax=Hyphomonas sp. TaxID=87 RepID=UPI003528C33D
MKQRWLALAVIFGLGACQAVAPAQVQTPEIAEEASQLMPVAGMQGRIDTMLAGMVQRGELAGGSALVWVDGQEVYFGAFGMADKEAGHAMDRETLVRIYSMTKPLTGVALMTLYEQGLFQLDDPLAKYFPEFADVKVYAGLDEAGEPELEAPARAPLVIDIMRHTAGFSGIVDDETMVGDMYRASNPMALDKSLQEMIVGMAEIPLLYQPGDRWLYGPSVDVQAALVERLSGKPFAEYLKETVLDPLGMSETDYYVPESERGRLAQVYEVKDDGTLVPDPSNDQGMQLPYARYRMSPGGYGIVTTIDDYMRFARMLLNGGELDGARILKPETVALMARDHLPETVGDRSWLPSKGQVGFGLDFAVRVAPPAEAAENYGVPGEFFWDGKASTLFWVDPANRLTAVLFVQFVPFNAVPAHYNFRNAVYGVRDSGAGG